MGGQTALNTAMALAENGTLERHGVELIGAKRGRHRQGRGPAEVPRGDGPRSASNRPKSAVVHTPVRGARRAAGRSACRRSSGPSFTLGGTGGGIAYNREEFEQIVRSRPGRLARPREVLIEESVLGWKEYEMEVVRDSADNCIIICSIENVDPMGIHTGDSVTVAPALTLTDKEYQRMRDASIAVPARDRRRHRRLERAVRGQPRRRPHGRDRDEPAGRRAPRRWRRRRPASRSPRSPPSSRSATRWTS